MRDLGKYFNTTDCFLCGAKTDVDFNCYYKGELYKAPLCFNCMAACPSDDYVLLKLMKKANKLHDVHIKAKG